MTCPTCGCDPCCSQSFCAMCRRADARKRAGKPPRFKDLAALWQAQPDQLPINYDDLSLDALWFKLNDPRAHQAPPPQTFTFDAAAVLRAVAALAEHAAARTLTVEIKSAWAREHAGLFKFPPAAEIADHIEHVAKHSKTVEKTILNVLGSARVEAGLAQQIHGAAA